MKKKNFIGKVAVEKDFQNLTCQDHKQRDLILKLTFLFSKFCLDDLLMSLPKFSMTYTQTHAYVNMCCISVFHC